MDRLNQPTAKTMHESPTPFYVAAGLLVLVGAVLWGALYRWNIASALSWPALGWCAVMLALAALFYVCPALLDHRERLLMRLPDAMRDMREMLGETENILKEYRRARTAIESLRESVTTERSTTEVLAHQLQEHVLNIQAVERDLQKTRMESAERAREVERWMQSAMDFEDFLHRILQQYHEDTTSAGLVRDIADVFAQYTAARGLERINLKPGDPLVPGLFQIVTEETNPVLMPDTVARCLTWGYRRGTTIIRPATVAIVKAISVEITAEIPLLTDELAGVE